MYEQLKKEIKDFNIELKKIEVEALHGIICNIKSTIK
jgi:hypothetical protein